MMTADTPLIVDLEGTFLRTDCLFEGMCRAVFHKPVTLARALPEALVGRASFKRRIAEVADLDVGAFPIRPDLLAYLEAEKAKGRAIHLVTPADQLYADAFQKKYPVFDSAVGSDGVRNMKGAQKRDYLTAVYPSGFVYAGDSRSDLQVWRKAARAVFADVPAGVQRRVRAWDIPVEAQFASQGGGWRAWLKALRLHQWAKNLLLFAPLLLAHAYTDTHAVLTTLLGFVIFGVAASGTYILNDLSDLVADRAHRSKHTRPFASGAASVSKGLMAAPVMIGGALIAALALNPKFALGVAVYLALTLAYSFQLKRKAMIDVVVLALLFTLRLMMGGALADVVVSEWLLIFSMFFFFSLSVAKRHVEIASKALASNGRREAIPGRGYFTTDAPLSLAVGVGSGVAAVLILLIYLIEDAFGAGVYQNTDWLWLAPAAIGLWVGRIWLLAHRGELDDDPVAFAVRDRWSLALGAAAGLGFLLSVLP